MIRRPLAAAVVCGLVVVGTPSLSGPAAASAGTVQVVDVPAGARHQPRTTLIVGPTDNHGLMIIQEADPARVTTTGHLPSLLLGPGGTAVPAGVDARDVLGDRVVTGKRWDSVTSAVLPATEPTTTAVPSGYTLLDYTGDGLLLSSPAAAGGEVLSVLPWAGGDPVPVTGELGAVTFGALSEPVHDVSGALVRAYRDGKGFQVFVSTTARRAWSLADPGAACDGSTGATWALGDGTIAWQTAGGDPRLICTVPEPAADAEVPGSAVARPSVDLPVANQWYDVVLLPVGDDVVVSRRAVSAYVDAPVYRVAPDGAATRLLGWGHDVEPGGAGAIVAVGGPSTEQASVIRVEVADGSATVLAPITPFPATATSLAVDDGRVVVMDDSASGRAVVERSLTFGEEPRAGEPLTLDTGVTDQVAVGDGATAWEKLGAWAVRDADGTTTTNMPTDNRWIPAGTQAVSGRWVLYRPGHVLDREQNVLSAPDMRTSTGDSDLVDGVLYLRGDVVSLALQDRVILRDLATGRATSVHVPGCAGIVGPVRAAGSWLMARCTLTQGGWGYVVVDRTGRTPATTLPDASVVLGNGFAVRSNSDSSLDWRPLADPSTDWQPLAPAGAADLVATGKGDQPSVAWSDGQSTQVALLPVVATASMPPPTGVLPPSAPAVTLTPYDRSIGVELAPAPVADELTGYRVTLGSSSPRSLGSDAAGTTFTSLTNGKTYSVTVSAANIAGRTSTTLSAVPLAPPAAPTNVRATVDPVTSRVQVAWDWNPRAASEALTGFDVAVGGFVGAGGLAPDARSAAFVLPDRGDWPVTVIANGPAQAASGDSASVTFPGTDTTAPSSSVGGVPALVLTSSVRLAVGGKDDRALSGIDVRWRSAAFGQRLGAWVRPTAWQGRTPGPLTVTGLRAGGTYCFSSRAHDAAGNVSPWTAARCSSVVLDDRALRRTGRWSSLSGSAYHRGTATRTNARYATLSRTSVQASEVWLVATTCPTCGTVTVFSGNTSFGAVSLRSATVRRRAVVKVPWPMNTRGTLRIVTWPRWGTVTIDGVAVRDY